MEGRTLWSDPTLDLAMVKVEAENDLVYAPLGNSEDLAIGETVVAIGTPLGLQFQHTVTSGIISGLNRTVKIPTNLGKTLWRIWSRPMRPSIRAIAEGLW